MGKLKIHAFHKNNMTFKVRTAATPANTVSTSGNNSKLDNTTVGGGGKT